jgi:hypothetical protein
VTAFLAPWMYAGRPFDALGGMYQTPGYDIAWAYGLFAGSLFPQFVDEPELFALTLALRLASLWAGLMAIPAYALLNLIHAAHGAWPRRQRWLVVLLVFGSLGLVIASQWLGLTTRNAQNLQWGYGLLWLAIASSVAVEFADRRSSMVRRQAGL